MGKPSGRIMLTAQDVQAHQALIATLPDMALADIVEAYREARRVYEARHWAGADRGEPEIRSEILARALADRLAAGADSVRGGSTTAKAG